MKTQWNGRRELCLIKFSHFCLSLLTDFQKMSHFALPNPGCAKHSHPKRRPLWLLRCQRLRRCCLENFGNVVLDYPFNCRIPTSVCRINRPRDPLRTVPIQVDRDETQNLKVACSSNRCNSFDVFGSLIPYPAGFLLSGKPSVDHPRLSEGAIRWLGAEMEKQSWIKAMAELCRVQWTDISIIGKMYVLRTDILKMKVGKLGI